MIINETVHNSKQTQGRRGTLYRCSGNLFIAKETQRGCPSAFVNIGRGRVVKFTAGAAQRMRRYLRECVPDYRNMVTITYPGFFTSNGKESKEHLRRFVQELKRYALSQDSATRYSAFWFLEFQERGAPHYHLFCTHDYPKEWVARTWYRIVNSEDERHLHAGTRIEKIRSGRGGTISYANKYAAKAQQKDVPSDYTDVGRFWGVSGDRATVAADTWVESSNSKGSDTGKVISCLAKVINDATMDGKMECYRRESGVYVGLIHDKDTERRLKLRICQLGALTGHRSQMFQDAETDTSTGGV